MKTLINKTFTVEVFDHCRQCTPDYIVEFNNVEDARNLMFILQDHRIPAAVHSCGLHARQLCVNHPNPYSHRCDWTQAELDGWK